MREYLLTLCVTAAVTYLLTGPVRKFAIAAGAMPEIRERDVHREPTPRLGGIAMFGGLCAGLLVASQMSNIGEMFELSSEPRALLAGAALIWLLGVLDDKWGVDALIKLGGQMIAAGVMVWQGLTILWIPVPGVGSVALTPMQGTLLTVALVVITINAVNFVDGLDGLASGMVCIAAAAFFMYAYRMWYGYGVEAAAPATLFAVILMGMALGFLPHNMHPARIFMGDSGSMLIGLVLAAGAISITGQVDPDLLQAATGSEKEAVKSTVPVYIPVVLLPLSIIAVPVADLVLAVVRRTWNGQSPFAADRGHLHHRLLEIGHSHSRAVLIMYFWSALIGFSAVAYSVNSASVWVVLALAMFSAVGLFILLLPRFTPRVPRWAQAVVPPRYRSKGRPAGSAGEVDEAGEAGQPSASPKAGAAGAERSGTVARANGATAVGARGGHRVPQRSKAGSRG
ncbi:MULTISPECIES: MraY family glycosyltransferase [Streptomyces]|uniref:Undecaprenyl/decaprenyl-phosphate alpha-N-acetylglucosaminyl 1-phosphate transferase n=2 Tax=Streptomyces TaxID=1883 RepID=A0A3R7FHM0_9ACTN|nr:MULTISPECIES: MraY family glycosyltransferase [Streptomyces]KNE79214.1 transferase [Streptomyces fradiae]OFA62002.1 undecaprenyl-phosphate alpha-N-acetylglucosaminyl 1-phosphate transferase [Streptomyces fradiae]PQM24326.1 undecaprenyl/decaprenyl-phosphate alpha-N-acetylglucosaminyl 1-phosphate transferase [Streptomyces xinghaiensis]RKM97294.1 undecaprenyl/decaprenyl-phosphate alpha-N-acetylglucosaminyl 1-phosphate transferase [Streptomyces xinghaiensis]RNC75310.1 undecaprenyl/decaprenyl-ph